MNLHHHIFSTKNISENAQTITSIYTIVGLKTNFLQKQEVNDAFSSLEVEASNLPLLRTYFCETSGAKYFILQPNMIA